MDRRTIIFFALAGVFMLLSVFVIPQFLQNNQKQVPAQNQEQEQVPVEEVAKVPDLQAVPLTKQIEEQTKTYHLNAYDVTFSNKGAVVTSFKINDLEKDPNNESSDDSIEMINSFDLTDPIAQAKIAQYPFALHFGDFETAPSMDLYEMKEVDDHTLEFTRMYDYKGVPFTVKKTYRVVDDEYILHLYIELSNSKNDYLPNLDGLLYTMEIGPQIGPDFTGEAPSDRVDYRKFRYINSNGTQETVLGKGAEPKIEKGSFSWISITGKYYALIASTNAQTKRFVFDSRNDFYVPKLRSAMYIERKFEGTPKRLDEYTFFIGPKKQEILAKYSDQKYGEVAPIDFPFGTIGELFKYPLDFFAGVTGNYGISIIILTILIKILFYPLTKKGQDSMKRMQSLNPKIAEIREKFKDDPKRMNMEIADLYKREKISPLGGCLPQLLQLPIMFALYNLFNNHFGLKGAPFIGWITDLSIPESLFKLPFEIPFLGDQFRLLPFIMLATQLLSTLTTQSTQATTGDNKMKYLPYILMGVFFFVLYNLPSGLVLYWTVQNFLTVLIIVIRNFVKERKLSFQM
ncbi:MAG: YidC/Oxa1 family insertase periplasmic-domain containing protein [Spirochaetales bacterium]|nr:YidC/Oxa1 family insertase periplasmic-domain containing protein [Spirochaetales bacterium]